MIVFFFALQGCFAGGGMYAQNPTYLAERFPTEVRATAGGFCYHQGAIFGGLTAPVLTFSHAHCLERQKRRPAGTNNSTNVRLTGQNSELFQWLALQLLFAADKDSLPTDSGVPP
jgi:MFS family permease